MQRHFVCVTFIVFINHGHVAESTCNRPPVPDGGNYAPQKNSYLEGERIKYSCDHEFLISGENEVLCRGNNKWEGNFPFCELKNVQVCLEECSKKTSYCNFSQELKVQQSVFTCGTYYAKSVVIKNIAGIRFQQDPLCEVEIFYQSDTLLCTLDSVGIEHGIVIYNASHAWLQCDEHYKPLQAAIKCGISQRNGINRFKCKEKHGVSNVTISIVSSLAVTLGGILLVFGCLILLKWRRHTTRHPSSRSTATTVTTMEETNEPQNYEFILLGNIRDNTPTLPITNKPTWDLPEIPAQDSVTLAHYYSQPLEDDTSQPCCLYRDSDHNGPYVDIEPQDAYKESSRKCFGHTK